MYNIYCVYMYSILKASIFLFKNENNKNVKVFNSLQNMCFVQIIFTSKQNESSSLEKKRKGKGLAKFFERER